MGEPDLDLIYRQLKDWQDGRQQLARDVQALRNDYPGFTFGIVVCPGEAAIEAAPRPGYGGELVAVIKPDAEGIREVLDAALGDP